ncbi:MAG: site-specific integrase [Deltaproteobacteria bacterium]|nr:site-specific integrase [Deltaproteobacteria bacterium]
MPDRHGTKWRARWLDVEGRRRCAVFLSHADAAAYERERKSEAEQIRRGLRPAPVPEHSFDELCDYWLTHRASRKRSAKDDESIIRRHLRPTFGALRVADASWVERYDAFASTFAATPKTLHNVATLLVSMLRCATDLGWIARCPSIRKPRIVRDATDFRYLRTPEEIGRFLRAARNEGPDVFTLYMAAVYTGMRAGELAGLRWEDIDLSRRLVTVQRSFGGPTKAGYVRYVPLVDALLPHLQAWRLQCPGDLVFPSKTGTMLLPSARIFQDVLQRVLRTAGFPDATRSGKPCAYVTFHDLRHTFASHWMMSGGDIFKLQRIGGWKSFAMVQRYAHLAPDAFTADYGRMPRVVVEESAAVIPLRAWR